MTVSIVTDSTADIPSDLRQELHIHVVPNLVIINGQSLEDGAGISRQDFYERLPSLKTPPSTATSSSGVYQSLYQKLFDEGASGIISLHPPTRLSGILNAATSAAREFGQKIIVLDSGYVSMGLGLQVLACAEAALKGLSLEELRTFAQRISQRVRLFAMLDTLEYVRRSGRVSWARARLGNLLQIKPFIELHAGEVLSLGGVRTRHKGIERLKQILRDLGPLERLAILHTNAEAEARQFLNELRLDLPDETLIVNVTTVIGAHVGPNGLGFAAVIQ